MSVMQFENYREIARQALKRATVSGEQPEPVTYVISMQKEMTRATSGKEDKTFATNDDSYRKHRNRTHLLDRDTGRGIQFSGGKSK